MVGQALDHEGGGGKDDRCLAGAAADEAGQRQHRSKGDDQRERGQRRQMAGQQSAPESQAQPRPRRGGFGLGGRQGERVRPERIRSGCPPSWLARGLGDERERVQTIGEFRRQQVINQTMPLDPAAALEIAPTRS